jgi:hypothetical protein
MNCNLTYWPLCVQNNKSDIVQSSTETRGPDSDIEMAGATTGTVLKFQDIKKKKSNTARVSENLL